MTHFPARILSRSCNSLHETINANPIIALQGWIIDTPKNLEQSQWRSDSVGGVYIRNSFYHNFTLSLYEKLGITAIIPIGQRRYNHSLAISFFFNKSIMRAYRKLLDPSVYVFMLFSFLFFFSSSWFRNFQSDGKINRDDDVHENAHGSNFVIWKLVRRCYLSGI